MRWSGKASSTWSEFRGRGRGRGRGRVRGRGRGRGRGGLLHLDVERGLLLGHLLLVAHLLRRRLRLRVRFAQQG